MQHQTTKSSSAPPQSGQTRPQRSGSAPRRPIIFLPAPKSTTTTTTASNNKCQALQQARRAEKLYRISNRHQATVSGGKQQISPKKSVLSATSLRCRWTLHLVFMTLVCLALSDLRRAAGMLLLQPTNGPLPASQFHQHNNNIQFYVFENAPAGTYVGTIRTTDGQTPTLVLPWQTPEADRIAALHINLTNGDITTNVALDREYRAQYQFIALASSPIVEIQCTVQVRDVNDNAPMFSMGAPNETTFVIEMPEGLRGIRKQLPIAVDYDSHQNSIKEFRIISGNTPSDMFRLVEHLAPARSSLQNNLVENDASASITDGADSPLMKEQLTSVLIPSQPITQSSSFQQQNQNQLSPQQVAIIVNSASPSAASSPQHSKYYIDLEVNQILDRENQSSYELVIEAIDGGQPPLIGRLMVTVNVQDINDNDPVFTKKLYECQFKEDTAKGTLLLRVQAHDVDLDANGQITYIIKRHSSASQPAVGSINSNSSDNNYDASSNGASSSRYISTSTTTNNNNQKQRQQQQPTIAPASTTNGAAAANQQAKQPQQMRLQGTSNEIHEQIIDASSNIPNNYPSKLKIPSQTNTFSQSQDQLFEIDPIKGEIRLMHQLDYETDQLHELLIEARDHGKPSRSAYATVKVSVLDINDDPAPINKSSDDRRNQFFNNNPPLSEPSRSPDFSPGRLVGDNLDGSGGGQNPITILNLTNWFAQLNSSLLFVIVLVALLSLLFPLCLVKIKSRQPESDYNDTAGLTLTSNNGQTKQSPNHSTSNEHSNGSNDNHHRHHDHQRRVNGSYAGLNGLDGSGFTSPNGKLRYHQYTDSSNLYHNPLALSQTRHSNNNHHQQPPDSPSNHQMATGGGGGSAGGTMTLHNHHGLLSSPGGHHHSLEHHHQFSSAGAGHHSSSLTYAHHVSRAALLQQVHHHQSTHHLSTVHHGHHNKGGTMNSVGTHHSAHPSVSPQPETPNTTHSSGLPPNLPDVHHGHGGHNPLLPLIPSSGQQPQLPPAPCHATAGFFHNWPQTPGSTLGCYGNVAVNAANLTSGSTIDCSAAGAVAAPPQATATSSQPLDRWFDGPGDSSQLVAHAQDWCGSYNWDYLDDWVPEYHTIMSLLLQGDA